MPSPSSNRSGGNTIDKLDYQQRRPLLSRPSVEEREEDDVNDNGESSGSQEGDRNRYAGNFFEQVADGIWEVDRARKTREVVRYGSFIWALIECLCAGSITAFSLYAPLLQRRLHYTQLRVNTISIAAELGMYLPVPLSGYLCDRYGPSLPSFLSGALFGCGYLLAAFAYRSGPPVSAGGEGWPFGVMVLAFVMVGVATSGMYLSAVSTCAKNFGRGKHKGLALALPIAAFGLSGMWQSQIGSRLLYETKEDGTRGGVDVFRYFLFLGITLLVVGVIGAVALRVVDVEEMIDEAVDELERSGLLEDRDLFHQIIQERGYGTLHASGQMSPQQHDEVRQEIDERKAKELREQQKKFWLLNEETRRFLSDKTMWLLAFGFFLITGPGEAFINNMGTIIDTLYPAGTKESEIPTSAATHVSIVAVTSTIARIFTGTLSDLLAPTAPLHQHRRGPNSMANSVASLYAENQPSKPFRMSRVTFLVIFSLLLSAGQVLLASGWIQSHAERFWLVSGAIGAGYGAVFSLTPIIISVVWGVENFGTNWGIVATVPAAGATVWGLVYSAVYERAANAVDGKVGLMEYVEEVLCHGTGCYSTTFWAMAVSVWLACVMWIWAWRGKGGWLKRGIAV